MKLETTPVFMFKLLLFVCVSIIQAEFEDPGTKKVQLSENKFARKTWHDDIISNTEKSDVLKNEKDVVPET